MKTKHADVALAKFRTGSSCAQAVLSEYLPQLGVPEPLAHKLGAGLGGGVGRKQYLCGALNAGAMVLSARLGNEDSADQDLKLAASEIVGHYVEAFETRFGSAQCRELIGFDLNTEQGKLAAGEADVFRKVCDSCVQYVCRQLDEVLGETT